MKEIFTECYVAWLTRNV